MSRCQSELEEAVFGPEAMDEALRPIEWAEDLVRWAREIMEQHTEVVEDPDAMWLCIREVQSMLDRLHAARSHAHEDAPAATRAE